MKEPYIAVKEPYMNLQPDLLTRWLRSAMVDRAWLLLDEMKDKNLPVGLETYNALLNVCAGGRQQKRAAEVL